MAVRTDSATWNCPTWSRIGVVPVVEGDTEKGDKTCASQKLCNHPYTTIKMAFWNIVKTYLQHSAPIPPDDNIDGNIVAVLTDMTLPIPLLLQKG
jgi:hypothetical protein